MDGSGLAAKFPIYRGDGDREHAQEQSPNFIETDSDLDEYECQSDCGPGACMRYEDPMGAIGFDCMDNPARDSYAAVQQEDCDRELSRKVMESDPEDEFKGHSVYGVCKRYEEPAPQDEIGYECIDDPARHEDDDGKLLPDSDEFELLSDYKDSESDSDEFELIPAADFIESDSDEFKGHTDCHSGACTRYEEDGYRTGCKSIAQHGEGDRCQELGPDQYFIVSDADELVFECDCDACVREYEEDAIAFGSIDDPATGTYDSSQQQGSDHELGPELKSDYVSDSCVPYYEEDACAMGSECIDNPRPALGIQDAAQQEEDNRELGPELKSDCVSDSCLPYYEEDACAMGSECIDNPRPASGTQDAAQQEEDNRELGPELKSDCVNDTCVSYYEDACTCPRGSECIDNPRPASGTQDAAQQEEDNREWSLVL